ncbi:hypothetical protein OP10G_2512 [Fimbriimonas ginsengisoli Gsoil 348]|uniref:Uncharacterized protein n=1 Tax=Fimbriimonas ginsengisoli Gsoil 348 TaxID=661478 RepID=A0A068NSX9_FIMGI|nr:hypothetical protein OP10G_2512 [Fimbriimonas ginsengisoli Gsoil 348]
MINWDMPGPRAGTSTPNPLLLPFAAEFVRRPALQPRRQEEGAPDYDLMQV